MTVATSSKWHYISIHALHVERDVTEHAYIESADISIHALHAEARLMDAVNFPVPNRISIHALHAERDRDIETTDDRTYLISIHALHAERDYVYCCYTLPKYYFNPRAPCGARLLLLGSKRLSSFISIHALHAERGLMESVR